MQVLQRFTFTDLRSARLMGDPSMTDILGMLRSSGHSLDMGSINTQFTSGCVLLLYKLNVSHYNDVSEVRVRDV